jgi:hypothetical protein
LARFALRVSPHPIAGDGAIQVLGAAGVVTVSLYDVSGRKLWEQRGSTELSWPPAGVTRPAPGVYFLRAVEETGERARSTVFRMVIAR